MNTHELINLDWLSVNYIIENSPLLSGEEYHTISLKYIPEKYTTRQFRYVYYVYDNYTNEEIATIVCCPLSRILDKRLHQVKLSNWLLYTDMAKGYLHRIKEDLSAQFLSISRIDICCDIVGFDFKEFIDKYHNNELREKSPKQVSEYYKKYNIDGIQESVYTGISWGSKSSDWTAKIYDKIREIENESGKVYILDYFKSNGINTDCEKVWRYEFSITSVKSLYVIERVKKQDYQYQYENDCNVLLDDDNVFDFITQRNLLKYYYNLHAFAENTGKVRFVDEKRYDILNLLSQELPPKRVRRRREKKKDYSAKVSINLGMQCLEYQTTCEAFITYKNIIEVAKEYHLTEWLLKKHGDKLQKIYIEKSFAMYGVGIMELIPQNLFDTKTQLKKYE